MYSCHQLPRARRVGFGVWEGGSGVAAHNWGGQDDGVIRRRGGDEICAPVPAGEAFADYLAGEADVGRTFGAAEARCVAREVGGVGIDCIVCGVGGVI